MSNVEDDVNNSVSDSPGPTRRSRPNSLPRPSITIPFTSNSLLQYGLFDMSVTGTLETPPVLNSVYSTNRERIVQMAADENLAYELGEPIGFINNPHHRHRQVNILRRPIRIHRRPLVQQSTNDNTASLNIQRLIQSVRAKMASNRPTSTSTAARTDTDTTAECSICTETYGNDMRQQTGLIRCGHVMCLSCLDALEQANRNAVLQCPFCKEPFSDAMLMYYP